MNNSLTESSVNPHWASEFSKRKFLIFYNGTSMAPLFKPGDLLCIEITKLSNIRLGDVVLVGRVWKNKNNAFIVHRAISVQKNYLIIQGDHNLKSDTQVILKNELIGLVISFSRNGHVFQVRRGLVGFIYAQLIHVRNYLLILVRFLGRHMYRQIRQNGLVPRIWCPTIIKLSLMTNQGLLQKYCVGSKTVARWWPQQRRFDVIKPFDLVIPHPEELLQYAILD